jgi:Nitrile hydratase, alpha chain
MAKKVNDLRNELIQKAITDPSFRGELTNNPKDTIAKFLGTTLPANLTIKVLQESPDMFYLVLPPMPPAGKTVSEEDLASFHTMGQGTGATAIQFTICC